MEDNLRESYSGESDNCQVSLDNTTLLLTILPSTFNQPNSAYYIKINPGFAQFNQSLESISGNSKYKWTIFTGIF